MPANRRTRMRVEQDSSEGTFPNLQDDEKKLSKYAG